MALPHKPGDHALLWNDETLRAPENFGLSAEWASEDAVGEIPDRYRAHVLGTNLSPALRWSTLPAGTVELALVVQDPDTPMAGAATHLVATIDVAHRDRLEDGALTKGSSPSGVVLGKGGIKLGWAGPMPPKGHGPHRYVFQAFAMQKPFDLRTGFRLAELRDALAQGVLGRAQLIGTYESR